MTHVLNLRDRYALTIGQSQHMERDKLILLKPEFTDPAYPSARFYCWHCALLEGVLALNPDLKNSIEIHRIDWPRPRQAVIDLIGAQNQSLPVLILAHTAPDGLETDEFEGRRFVGATIAS